MDQGVIVAALSVLFYFTTLLGGQPAQPVEPIAPPAQQQSYSVLGQTARIVADTVTVRSAPSPEAAALGVVRSTNQGVMILDKQDGWYKIRPSSGPTGWVPDYALTITPVLPKDLDRVILGYYIPGEQAYGSMLEHSTKLTAAAPLGWTLDSYGGLSADFDPQEMGRSLYFAGNQELETFAHVQVASHPTRLLTSSYLKQNTISQLVSTVEEWGLKGILLNIAYVPGAEQPELFAFLESLSAELQAKGLRTLVGLPLSADIDYQAASGSVDYVVLYSALQKDGPGPLAALPELESQLSAITQAIDSRKIILALSTSALDWSRTGSAQVLSHGEVLELAAQQGAKVRWDPVSMTPYFHYGNGGEVWFENRYSLKHKLELVAKYQLGGAALANLGQEDPELWNSVEDLLVG